MTNEVPKLRFDMKDGLVTEIHALWEDGIDYELNDRDFLNYVNMGLCTLPQSNKSVPLVKESDSETHATEAVKHVEDFFVGERKEVEIPDPEIEDNVNHPKHYTSHPSGIECIEISRWYDFDIGNAIKYLWRHGLKHDEGKDDFDKAIEDLEKAKWYINDEIAMVAAKKKAKQQKEDSCQ